jgi:hypothetical protein
MVADIIPRGARPAPGGSSDCRASAAEAGRQLTRIEKTARGCAHGNCPRVRARKLHARLMRIGCDLHHGCRMRPDALGAGLSGGTGFGLGVPARGVRWRRAGYEWQAAASKAWQRKHRDGGGVKPRSREAVRLLAQGFTRDDSPGEDGCGVLWVERGMARWESVVVRSHATSIAISYRPVEGDG